MNILDCYKILNISKGSNWEQVKRSYYTLAKKYHPDLNFGDSFFESRFKKISQAYRVLNLHYRTRETLKNVKKKNRNSKTTNRQIHTSFEPILKSRKQGSSETEDEVKKEVPSSKWKSKIKEIIFKYENKWAPLIIRQGVTINQSLALKGGIIRIKTSHDSFHVKIPPGIKHQVRLRIPSKGEKSFFNDKRGDLFLNIRIIPAGKTIPGTTNMFYEKKVTRENIDQNRVFTLNTFQGPIKFFVPKKTRDGELFILNYQSNKTKSNLRVNHIVTLRVT